MQGVALVRNHPVMLFTGILLGLLSSISFIRQSALIKVTTTMEKSELQKNSREETKFHETLYIGVMTSKILPNTKSVHSTWGQATKNIEYFVTDGQNINHLTHHLPVVNLTSIASDKINPLLFELYSVLLYMYHTCIDKFNWFMIANDHLYVRVPKLIKLLTKLDPTADIYLGSPSRTPQNKDLFFRAHRQQGWFCKYSTGIILSRELLRKLVPHLKQCLKDAKLGGSPDVLLGVCIKRNIRIQCSSSLEVTQYFYNDYHEGEIFGRIRYDNTLKHVVTAYPFKTQELMYHIHQIYLEVDIKELKKEKTLLLQKYRALLNDTLPRT